MEIREVKRFCDFNGYNKLIAEQSSELMKDFTQDKEPGLLGLWVLIESGGDKGIAWLGNNRLHFVS